MQLVRTKINSRFKQPLSTQANHKGRSYSVAQNFDSLSYVYPFVRPKYMHDKMFNKRGYSQFIKQADQNELFNNNDVLEVQVKRLKSNIDQIRSDIKQQRKKFRINLQRQQKDDNISIATHRKKLKNLIRHKTQIQKQVSRDLTLSNKNIVMFLQKKKKNGAKSQYILNQKEKKQQVQVQEMIGYFNDLKSKQYNYPKIFDNIVVRQPLPLPLKGYIKKQVLILKKQIDIKPIKKRLKILFKSINFLIRLKIYNKKYRTKRLNYIKRYSPSFTNMYNQLKNHFLIALTDFFINLVNQDNKTMLIIQSDIKYTIDQKLKVVRRIINDLLKYLIVAANQLVTKQQYVQLIYNICKHGSFAHKTNLLTEPQLALNCISSTFGYLSSDKYLQKVSIISMLLIKIILYNIFFQPQCIEVKSSMYTNRPNFVANLSIIGNVFYQICILLQDDYLDSCSQLFVINNYKQLQHKYQFFKAPTMTVKKNVYQKNELISGLILHDFMKQLYNIEEMRGQRKLVSQFVNVIFDSIRKKHRQVFQQCL